ncbi:Na+/H+ antiporter [Paenibacillus physcomitrellae]|uniref:Sodium, potassium, lithium and rubidium/H(+) antiporter n=1 Tax=Paenibacillus physcomitrellae TaxID=1619311 RepID=A0ABQ1GKS7_9BACL|nr:Na+/H+ antiporter [Paenibacillus physcomitrellae]GGA45607.1 sodium, potassium, lithium and rubidium/H(+) antiporter [Paenibacillus physcomitrellae]
MEIFFSVLILLGLIGLSNLLNRFAPFVPVPLFQIALGAVISIIPPHIHLPLNPELFFVLFIAPLLYNDGKKTPRDELWSLRAPILLMALGLVFATVVVAGYFIHFRIPSIPLAAAFALAAILSPTDAVAVSSIASRIKLPRRILRLLEGESLMNDASGLVAFKFAVAAAVTGVFSLVDATLSFFLIAIGGLLIGAVLALLIYRLQGWIRSLGMEDVTLLMLVQILTPFLIYLIAEEIGVSGILAVVAAGLVHSIDTDRISSPHYRLRITSDSTWSVILFLLNGLVFVILGLQLPDVGRVIFNDPNFSNGRVLGYIVQISLLLLALRFVWVYLFWRVGNGDQQEQSELDSHRFKTSLLISLSGVRGTVTLAGAFSIPFMLGNGASFPERNLIIFIAAGVILFSLLTASIVLPLLSRDPNAEDEQAEKQQELTARVALLQKAISVTKEEMTPSNQRAAMELISYYNQEIREMQSLVASDIDLYQETECEIRLLGIKAERAEIELLLSRGEIAEQVASKFFDMIDEMEYMLTTRRKFSMRFSFLRLIFRRLFNKLFRPSAVTREKDKLEEYKEAKLKTCQAAIQAISNNLCAENRMISTGVITRYKEMIYRLSSSREAAESPQVKAYKKELRMKAVQAERDEVQTMYEKGSISRSVANKLRQFVNMVEASLLDEEPEHG